MSTINNLSSIEAIVREGDIAIIGVACRFPGAENPQQFWQNLRHGVESISFFTDAELEEKNPTLPLNPNYVKAGSILSDIAGFDADFFAYSPNEAAMLDPQQRILLECAWEALEAAGYVPDAYPGRVGVYAGSGMSHYFLNQVHSGEVFTEVDWRQFQAYLANDRNFLPTRISYKLNLTGPSVNIQTACSTGLVVVHQACQSLLLGECDLALAGTVSLRVPLMRGYLYEEGMVRSPDGHCRAFDAAAEGTLFGNGAGMVVLKPAREALSAGDPILALIKGSAINNDGGSKVSFTAPSIPNQAAVIVDALMVAEIDPVTISYVEAHGTGTRLGDPVEILALTQAFSRLRRPDILPNQFCAIGSVKTNIGHLDEAAGIAGLIKTVLALKHKEIPPSLHAKMPNPQIDFENSPFYVNTALTEWQTNGIPRRAGVSSFGMGGTNSHLVLEEAPIIEHSPLPFERDKHLLTLSAKTPQALEQLAQRYVDYLLSDAAPETSLADICFTANTGRKHFSHRAAFVVESNQQLRTELERFIDSDAHGQEACADAGSIKAPARKIAFLFTGQGSQYINMGRQLYESQPIFRQTIDRCDDILRVGKYLQKPLLSVLYPEATHQPTNPPAGASRWSQLNETAYTQPALFALEYALAQVWRSWGIEPDVVMGHSVGEYVAACVAGVFSLEDGLKLIAERGRLMQALPQNGEMVSVMASHEQVVAFLDDQQVSIAAINGPQSVVISGERQAVQAVVAKLLRQGLKCRQLSVSHAFHSPLMEPMQGRFAQVASQITYNQPQITMVSNLTGRLVSHELTAPAYWVRHVREPVHFAAGMASLHALGVNIFLEIGPKPILLGMGQHCLPDASGTGRLREGTAFLASLRPLGEWPQMLASLGELYVRGVDVDWEGADSEYQRRKVVLPTYPFQRERYWVETKPLTKTPISRLTPLIDKLIRSPRLKEIVCETNFSVERLPFLADHLVFGELISPAACQLAMALEAAQLAYPQQTVQLVDVVLPQALALANDSERTVQVVLSPESNGTEIRFELISFIAAEQADQTLQIHASGGLAFTTAQVHPEPVEWVPAVDIVSLQTRLRTVVNLETLDALAVTQQIHFGPSFRWLAEVWSGEKEVLGRLLLPKTIDKFHEYQLHPALLDACLQLTSALNLSQENTETYLPFALDSLTLLGEIKGREWWGYARQIEEQRWHIQLLDDTGRVLVQIEGFSERVAPRHLVLGREAWREWLYEVQWEPQPLPDLADHESGEENWLIVAARESLGAQLANQLQASGAECTFIPTEQFVNPSLPEHHVSLKSSVLTDVVYLAQENKDKAGRRAHLEVPQRVVELNGELLHLVQALTRHAGMAKEELTARLWVITENAQAVHEEEHVNYVQASLWGLARTIAHEYPDLNCTSIDWAEGVGLSLLLAQLRKPGEENQIALRGTERYVARLSHAGESAKVNFGEATSKSAARIHADGSYLITGGLGGLGLQVAQQLVAEGAGQLVLASRRAIRSERTQKLILELEEAGAKVHLVQADVSVESDVASLLSACPKPLRGIIHAAGVLDDGVLSQQTVERFEKVMAPKVKGAWHLHCNTCEIPLDFFVCFSSIASLLGGSGQGNYAAANAFLDGLMSHRHAMGLPGLSINWGAWSKVGMAAEMDQLKRSRIESQGFGFIKPEQGIQVFAHLLGKHVPLTACPLGIAVSPINWKRFLSGNVSGNASFFAKVNFGAEAFALVPKDFDTKEQVNFRQKLTQALTLSERSTMVTNMLREMVSTIGGFTGSHLDNQQSLLSMGLDSLMAIELRNHATQVFEITIPISMFLDGSIASLATYIIEHISETSIREPIAKSHQSPKSPQKSSLTQIGKAHNHDHSHGHSPAIENLSQESPEPYQRMEIEL